MESAMRSTLSIGLFACSLAWCIGGACEEKQLDPGVINDWMRSAVFSESGHTETARVVHIKLMENWKSRSGISHVRYEVANTDCKRTLMIYITDTQGQCYRDEWVKLIEDDQARESKQLANPSVFARAYREGATVSEFPIVELKAEYQVRDGLPVLVALNQQDVKRAIREFKRGDRATIRMDAFDSAPHTFELSLDGFGEKVEWSQAHCPDEAVEEKGDDKDTVLSPTSS